jgi:hypothetical protein
MVTPLEVLGTRLVLEAATWTRDAPEAAAAVSFAAALHGLVDDDAEAAGWLQRAGPSCPASPREALSLA